MNAIWPSASRISCLSTRTVQKNHTLSWCITQLVYCPVRRCTAYPTSSRLKSTSSRILPPFKTVNLHASTLSKSYAPRVRTYASLSRIITKYEDLPITYEDSYGLRYRRSPLSKDEVVAVFGKGVDVGAADRVLRILHGRRVAGTLEDPTTSPLPGFENNLRTIALEWLRKNVKVDETRSAGMRAEYELDLMESEITTDAEKLGIYKPNAGETIQKDRKGKGRSQSIYGKSGLDAIREEHERRLDEKEKAETLAREKEDANIQQTTGTLTTPNLASRVELRRPGENPWLKHYLERAKVLPDKPLDVSPFKRLWPSALLALCVIAGSIAFTTVYSPPTSSGRMFPDIPPAAATVGGLIVANAVICVLWRFPPAFRTLNKYFVSVPGYPRALAVIGNTFSHQSLSHLTVNMLVLWFLGTRLHDDIGRANFLAIYFSGGALSTLTSLTAFTLRKNLVTSSMGASGAIAGVMAAYLWLHRDSYFKFLGLPPDPLPGISGLGLLACIVVLECWQLHKGWNGALFDHYAHLGGYGAGVLATTLLERQPGLRERLELRRKRKNLLDRQYEAATEKQKSITKDKISRDSLS